MEVLSPWSFFARKMQIIFVTHEQLILMRSKDNKLMETWAWDRSLSMNCREFCLGQHRETINFALPARRNQWFEGEKKNTKTLLSQDVLAVFIWLSCFQENALCPWHWLAFSPDFSQPLSVCLKLMEPNFTKIQSPEQSLCVQSACFSCKQRNAAGVQGCHFMPPSLPSRSFTGCVRYRLARERLNGHSVAVQAVF